MKKDLPDDIEIEVGFDNTQYIRSSIREVEDTILIAFILVVVIIFFFLRNWRTTLDSDHRNSGIADWCLFYHVYCRIYH